MRIVLISLAVISGVSFAQDPGVQRALIQRDQQSAAFGLQLRQSQEALKVTPANRANLESRQLSDRQRLDNMGEKQLLELKPDAPDSLRPYERQKAGDERRPIVVPIAPQ